MSSLLADKSLEQDQDLPKGAERITFHNHPWIVSVNLVPVCLVKTEWINLLLMKKINHKKRKRYQITLSQELLKVLGANTQIGMVKVKLLVFLKPKPLYQPWYKQIIFIPCNVDAFHPHWGRFPFSVFIECFKE